MDLVRKIKEFELYKRKLQNPIINNIKFLESQIEIKKEFSRKNKKWNTQN